MFFLKKLKDGLAATECPDEMAALNTIFKEMVLEQIPAQTVVVQEKDASNNKAYIVLDGEIGIWITNKTKVFEDDYKKLQNKIKGKKDAEG